MDIVAAFAPTYAIGLVLFKGETCYFHPLFNEVKFFPEIDD